MNCMTYEFLEHTADVKFRAIGANIEEAFIESSKALFETMYEGVKIVSKNERKIEINGSDIKNLLYDFLEEFIFLLESEQFVCANITKLKIEGMKLSMTVMGDSAKKYEFSNSVKAPTYNDMEIVKEDNGWKIVCVLDV